MQRKSNCLFLMLHEENRLQQLDSFFKYLNIGPEEEKWGMYITTVGYAKVQSHDRYPNQEHPQSHALIWDRGRILNDYYIVFISKGKGVYGSKDIRYEEISEGMGFFIFPNVWHRYKPDSETGWEEYWVGFNGYYIQELMVKAGFSAEAPFVHVSLNKDILVLFGRLLDVAKEFAPGYPQQLAGLTLQMLGLINTIRLFRDFDNDPVGRLIVKAKFLLQQSVDSNVSVEEIARKLPMGYSSFRKAFKKITGKSPNQYQLDLRLSKAKELLAKTTLNMSEIADHTGFGSVFYFSSFFKKNTGFSPLAYRKATC